MNHVSLREHSPSAPTCNELGAYKPNWRRQIKKALPLVITASLCLIIGMLGISEEWTGHMGLTWLRLFDVSLTGTTDPTQLSVDHNQYEIGFWCTPLFLWGIAALILYHGRQSSRRYLADWLCFALLTQLMIPIGIAASIRLHSHGIPWVFAHYPIYVFNYATSIGACLAYSGRRVRHSRIEQARK